MLKQIEKEKAAGVTHDKIDYSPLEAMTAVTVSACCGRTGGDWGLEVCVCVCVCGGGGGGEAGGGKCAGVRAASWRHPFPLTPRSLS